jgi:hypothetical protein
MNSEEFYNKVYDILVATTGANESDRFAFIYNHVKSPEAHLMEEWRFCGKLGFGGKYWKRNNWVTCYKEDETREARSVMKKTNEELKALKDSI